MRDGPAPPPKRFYREATAAPSAGGFAILLDGRPARTPARQPFDLPTRALADAVAAEWSAQGASIDPAAMPMTRLANTAIDGVRERPDAVAADIARYGASDLVVYRAGGPDRLVAAQAAAWDPVLAWAREVHGLRFVLSEGVMFVVQPPATLRSIRTAVDATPSPFGLAALHTLTTLTGSVLLALAVRDGGLGSEAAWAAAHVDEAFQEGLWGQDAEAAERRGRRWAEFEAAASFLRFASA